MIVKAIKRGWVILIVLLMIVNFAYAACTEPEVTDCTGNDGSCCDDGDLCTTDDTCFDGACLGTAIQCPDTDCASNGACNAGVCVYSSKESDIPCSNSEIIQEDLDAYDGSLPSCVDGKCGKCYDGSCRLNICGYSIEIPDPEDESQEVAINPSGQWCPDTSGLYCPNSAESFYVNDIFSGDDQGVTPECCSTACISITRASDEDNYVKMFMACEDKDTDDLIGRDYNAEPFCDPDDRPPTYRDGDGGTVDTDREGMWPNEQAYKVICEETVPHDCICEGDYIIWSECYDKWLETDPYLTAPPDSNSEASETPAEEVDEVLCTNDCSTANDGQCDDGGDGSATSGCGLGTDCCDCGLRISGDYSCDEMDIGDPCTDETYTKCNADLTFFCCTLPAETIVDSAYLAYSINYDEDEDDCEICGRGIWDPNAPESYDVWKSIERDDNGWDSATWFEVDDDSGSCCGDDSVDDPDMGEIACELCSRGDNYRTPQDVGEWYGATINSLIEDGTISASDQTFAGSRRAWGTNAPSDKRCCGDDEDDDCFNNQGNLLCYDREGTSILGTLLGQQQGQDTHIAVTGSDCLDPFSCPGYNPPTTTPDTPSPTEIIGITLIGSIWSWTPSGNIPGIVIRAKCADLPIVSDNTKWMVCGETDARPLTENFANKPGLNLFGLGPDNTEQINRADYGFSDDHDYFCYKDEDDKYQIAECCGSSEANCYTTALGKNYGGILLTTGDILEYDGEKFYCREDFTIHKNLDAPDQTGESDDDYLDLIVEYETACESVTEDDLNIFTWTGQYCCSEDEDQIQKSGQAFFGEWYNDDADLQDGQLGACAGNFAVLDEDMPMINDDDNLVVSELIVKDGKFHGCAISEADPADWIIDEVEDYGHELADYDGEVGPFTSARKISVFGGSKIFFNNFVANYDFEDGTTGWTGHGIISTDNEGLDDTGYALVLEPDDLSTQDLGTINKDKIAISLWIKADGLSSTETIPIDTKLSDSLGLAGNGADCFITKGEITNNWQRFDASCQNGNLDNTDLQLPGSTEDGVDLFYDNIMVGTNDDLLSLKDCPDPANDGCGDELITDHAYCDVVARKFCSYQEIWKGGTGSRDKTHLSYWPIDPADLQEAECCKPTQCWDPFSNSGQGDCIDDQSLDGSDEPYPRFTDNTEKQSYTDAAGLFYRCVEGEWDASEPKYTWDNRITGFCPNSSMCLVNPSVNRDDPQRPIVGDPVAPLEFHNFYNSDDPGSNDILCINNEQYINDHFCECIEGSGDSCTKASWTSRTKKIAEVLTAQAGNRDFNLFCGNYDIASNYLSDRVKGYILDGNNIENVCVLNYLDGTQTKVVIGYGAKPMDFTLQLIEEFLKVQNCPTTGTVFSSCTKQSQGQYSAFYNPKIHAIIFSEEAISSLGSGTFWSNIATFFQSLGTFITTGNWPASDSELGASFPEVYDFVEFAHDYKNIYISKQSNPPREIFAIVEKAFEPGTDSIVGGEFIAIKYEGYTDDICAAVNDYKLKKREQGSVTNLVDSLMCIQDGTTYSVRAEDTTTPDMQAQVFSTDDSDQQVWLELLAKLRPQNYQP